jgi:HK97 family phage prohead protease
MKLYKSIPLELKADSEGNYKFEAYVSTFGNVDLGGDVVMPGAFSKSIKENPSIPILWQHKHDMPIGQSTNLFEDSKGLFVKYDLPKEDTFVSGRVLPQVKIGSIKEMSMGYWANEYSHDSKTGNRHLDELTIFEGSLVTKAMNPEALITAFKSIDSIRSVENYLKMNGISGTESKTLISMIHNLKNSDQCDADPEASQRDVDAMKGLFTEVSELKTLFTEKPLII